MLVAVWRVRLGRVKLYLLDTDLEENAPWDRELSARLYGGDRETRVQQEIILGIGGVRALRRSACDPAVWHLNEGHAAFVVLQRIRDFFEQGRSFDAALDEVRRTTVFTTHTPVPAGHDAFPFHLVETASGGLLGLARRPTATQFLALGLYDNGSGPQFNMTALAMRSSARVNAVSQLHGEVTREMWVPIWPDGRMTAAGHARITNGVHVPTWMSSEMAQLCSTPSRRRTGSNATTTRRLWDAVLDIPDEELWAVRRSLRSYLFQFIRERARQRWTDEQVSATGSSRAARCSIRRADDRLRAPVHRLQTARADLPRPGPSGPHPDRARTPGAAGLRGQGASGRRSGQASPAACLSARAQPRVRRTHGVR